LDQKFRSLAVPTTLNIFIQYFVISARFHAEQHKTENFHW